MKPWNHFVVAVRHRWTQRLVAQLQEKSQQPTGIASAKNGRLR
eukprot:COSAG06_NODE_5069_length_3749_cov_9.249315_1_plen_42_part_10